MAQPGQAWENMRENWSKRFPYQPFDIMSRENVREVFQVGKAVAVIKKKKYPWLHGKTIRTSFPPVPKWKK